MHTYKRFFSLIFVSIFFVFPLRAYAAVLINEISSSTDPEWVELYNDSDTPVDLSGYLLEDGNSSQTDDLGLTGSVPGKSYLVFAHAEGWLNNSGDTLKLYNNAVPQVIIDQYTYGNVDSSHSMARIPDGSENWGVTSTITKGSQNPSPTPSPSPTSTATSEPTQTPTSTPTSTPTVTPTKTPTPKPSPTKTPLPSSSPEVLGENIAEPIISPSPQTSAEVESDTLSKKKFPFLPVILIGSGLSMVGLAVLQLINAAKANKASPPVGSPDNLGGGGV